MDQFITTRIKQVNISAGIRLNVLKTLPLKRMWKGFITHLRALIPLLNEVLHYKAPPKTGGKHYEYT